jgi:hypothetical protein
MEENLTELLKEREKLDQKLFDLKNQKVLSEVADLDAQISDLQTQKLQPEAHRKAEDPKLLEQIEHHENEKVRLKNVYFSNTYKIKDLENQIIHFSTLRREKLACISEGSNN